MEESPFYSCLACDGGLETVIASQRVGAKRRPMTGSAKQSSFREATKKVGLLRRYAPLRKRFAFVAGNDGGDERDVYATNIRHGRA
jgi:hypothetical protein